MAAIDAPKLAELFDAHAGRLVIYARQWLDRAAAEDAVQDAFLRLMEQRRAPESVPAWLFATVRNAALDRLRSARRRQAREEASARGEWFDSGAEELIDARSAQAALHSLPEAHREVVVLRIWGQLTLAQIAQVVGLPLSTVFDHYRNAMSALRAALEKPCRKTPN